MIEITGKLKKRFIKTKVRQGAYEEGLKLYAQGQLPFKRMVELSDKYTKAHNKIWQDIITTYNLPDTERYVINTRIKGVFLQKAEDD